MFFWDWLNYVFKNRNNTNFTIVMLRHQIELRSSVTYIFWKKKNIKKKKKRKETFNKFPILKENLISFICITAVALWRGILTSIFLNKGIMPYILLNSNGSDSETWWFEVGFKARILVMEKTVFDPSLSAQPTNW